MSDQPFYAPNRIVGAGRSAAQGDPSASGPSLLPVRGSRHDPSRPGSERRGGVMKTIGHYWFEVVELPEP